MTDPIDLDAHRPHEVSKMLCTRCGHKWTAVHPVGTTGLECPNCHEMEGQQMSEIVKRLRKKPPSLGFEEYDPTFDVRQEAASRIEALEREVAKLREGLKKIADGTRDGQHCALIANTAIEDDKPIRAAAGGEP